MDHKVRARMQCNADHMFAGQDTKQNEKFNALLSPALVAMLLVTPNNP